LLVSADGPGKMPIVLWEPILDPTAYVQELLRVNVSTQTTMHKTVLRTRPQLLEALSAGERVSINGYNLCWPFVRELLELRPEPLLPKVLDRALVILRVGTKCAVELPPGTPQLEMPVFWKEPKAHYTSIPALEDASLRWIRDLPSRVSNRLQSAAGRATVPEQELP
jgi:hypothetical protein